MIIGVQDYGGIGARPVDLGEIGPETCGELMGLDPTQPQYALIGRVTVYTPGVHTIDVPAGDPTQTNLLSVSPDGQKGTVVTVRTPPEGMLLPARGVLSVDVIDGATHRVSMLSPEGMPGVLAWLGLHRDTAPSMGIPLPPPST